MSIAANTNNCISRAHKLTQCLHNFYSLDHEIGGYERLYHEEFYNDIAQGLRALHNES